MTVNNTTATLNEPLQIYQNDRGITLRIKVLRYKYTFGGKIQETDVVAETGMFSARAESIPDSATTSSSSNLLKVYLYLNTLILSTIPLSC